LAPPGGFGDIINPVKVRFGGMKFRGRDRPQAFSERFNDAEHRAQCPASILAAHFFEQLPEAERFLLSGLGKAVGHSLGNIFEQLRFKSERDFAQNQKIAGGVDCFGRFRGIYDDRKHFVARTEATSQKIQDAPVVEDLEHFIPGKQSLGVLQRGVLQSGLQLKTRVTRRKI